MNRNAKDKQSLKKAQALALSLEKARRLIETRRFEAAEQEANKAAGIDPDYFEVHEVLAHILMKRSDFTGAIQEADKAIASARSNGMAPTDAGRLIILKAELKRHLSDFDGCCMDAGEALSLLPTNPGAYLTRAEGERGRGRFEAALKAIGRAIELSEKDPWLRVVRAKILRGMGKNKEALVECDRALKMDRSSYKTLGWRGEILRALKSPKPARTALDQALKKDSNCAWVLGLRGQLRIESGDEEGGEADLEAAMQLDPHCSGAYDFLGDGATGLAGDPRTAWMWAWRGISKSWAGDLSGALNDLERSVALDGRWAWTHCRLGEIRLQIGRSRQARECFDRALERSRSNLRARFWRGESRRSEGDLAGAQQDLDIVIKKRSKHALAYLSRAMIKEARGDRPGMISDFKRGYRLAPDVLRGQAETMLDAMGAEGKKLREMLRR